MSQALLLILVGALTAASCARASPQVEHARSNAKQHQYQVPLEEVWPFALQLVEEQGFTIDKNQARDEGARFSAETAWLPAGNQQVRMIVQGTSYADNSSHVSFMRQRRYLGRTEVSLDRDLDMEWRLLRLVDPDAAAAIEEDGPPLEEQ